MKHGCGSHGTFSVPWAWALYIIDWVARERRQTFPVSTETMELFRSLNIDWLGKKWYFIIASFILSAAGIVSLLVKGGPRYSIDFRGGTLV